MMGAKTLAALREELRAAFAAERSNPIAALDREIRKVKKRGAGQQSRSLGLLREALAQVVGGKPPTDQRAPRRRGSRKAS